MLFVQLKAVGKNLGVEVFSRSYSGVHNNCNIGYLSGLTTYLSLIVIYQLFRICFVGNFRLDSRVRASHLPPYFPINTTI